MTSLRAVLFDVDDTLFSTTAFAARARENAVDAMLAAGLSAPREEVLRELSEVISEFSSNYDHHFDKLLMRVAPGLPGNPALIVAAGVAAYHDTKFRDLEPFPDVVPLLRDLVSAGLTTGVVTHGWTVKQAEKLVRLGLVPHLDPRAVFISEQIGISKPNPKLYQAAVRALGLEPGEVMYVGDSPDHDIVPAAAIGMITVYSRRASRYPIEGAVPDHVVNDFGELRGILADDYGIAL